MIANTAERGPQYESEVPQRSCQTQVDALHDSKMASSHEDTVVVTNLGSKKKPVVTLVLPEKEELQGRLSENAAQETVKKSRKVSFRELDIREKDEETKLLKSSPQCNSDVRFGKKEWRKVKCTVRAKQAMCGGTKYLAPPSGIRKKRSSNDSLNREDSFLKRFSTRPQAISKHSDNSELEKGDNSADDDDAPRRKCRRVGTVLWQTFTMVITTDSSLYCYWLSTLTAAVLYNLWMAIAREAFPELQSNFQDLWFVCDGIADTVYLLDVIVQLRTGYLEQGIVVRDSRKLAKHYVTSRAFVYDLMSILPLDVAQVWTSSMHPMLRFTRYLKVYRTMSLYYIVESRTMFPNLWRVVNLIHILLLLAHWFAAFYYAISVAEEFRGRWTYTPPSAIFATLTRKYLACLYWSTLTLTTIGDLPPPETNWE